MEHTARYMADTGRYCLICAKYWLIHGIYWLIQPEFETGRYWKIPGTVLFLLGRF